MLDLRHEVAPLGARVLDAERHLERDEHEQRDAEVAEEQPPGHAARRRKPTPRTVSIQPGSPSLRRSAATWTSIVFAEPYQVVSQTSSSRRRRLTAAPGSRASAASRSNSFGVRSSSWPSSSARRARSSTSRPPTRSGAVRLRPGGRPARDGADAGDQLAQPERLDDVVVGAELEPDDPVGLLAARGDDDDRHVGALAQLPADVEPVGVREPQVEQDEVRLGRLERRRTGRGALDLEALAAEPLDERLGDCVLVLDDQDAHGDIVAAPGTRCIGSFPNLCNCLPRSLAIRSPGPCGGPYRRDIDQEVAR